MDRVVYLPVLKTHRLAQFSMTLKMAMGIVKPSQRWFMHLYGLRRKIVDVCSAVLPDLSIIDACKCFITGGPMEGEVREPGLLLASGDPVALDVEGVLPMNHKSAFKTAVNVAILPCWESALRSWLDSAGDAIDIPAIDHYPGTKTLDGCPEDYPEGWKELDDLFQIMRDYSKEGALMETGYSSWGAFKDENDQEIWMECHLPHVRGKIRSHASSSPKLPLLLGILYELVDEGTGGGPNPELHWGLLRTDLTVKPAYAAFRIQVSNYEL